jgi:uncharacterized membrane protein
MIHGLDQNRALGVLFYLAVLMFVVAGLPALRWRRTLQRGAIAVYLLALAVVAVLVGVWLVR